MIWLVLWCACVRDEKTYFEEYMQIDVYANRQWNIKCQLNDKNSI